MLNDAAKRDIEKRILDTDIVLLTDHGVSDDTMMTIAAEYAARTERLCKLMDPTRGKAMLLMVSKCLIDAGSQITAATVQEPELMHV